VTIIERMNLLKKLPNRQRHNQNSKPQRELSTHLEILPLHLPTINGKHTNVAKEVNKQG